MFGYRKREYGCRMRGKGRVVGFISKILAVCYAMFFVVIRSMLEIFSVFKVLNLLCFEVNI